MKFYFFYSIMLVILKISMVGVPLLSCIISIICCLSSGTDDQNSHVVGGHACVWGELVDSSNFMARMW